MKKSGFLFLLALTTLLNAPAAHADQYSNGGSGFKFQKETLQPANFYVHPREYQIIDRRPTVVDTRRPDAEPNVINLDIGPLQSRPGSTTTVGGGGAQPGNALFKGPSAELQSLPQVRFGSEPNFDANRFANKNLPNGTTVGTHTNTQTALAGKISPRDRLQHAQAQQMTGQRAQPAVLNYNNTNQAAANSAGSRSEQTNVSGQIVGGKSSMINRLMHNK